MPPNWSSDRIRGARPLTPEPALSFRLETSKTGAGASSASTEQATLALSFTAGIAPGSVAVLYDHRLCRMLTWKAGASTLAGNLNCHAVPMFRLFEIQSRRAMEQMLASGLTATGKAAPTDSVEPYWNEAELSAVIPGAPDRLTREQTGDTIHYRLHGLEVVSIEAAATSISPEEAKRFVRLMTLAGGLHPQVLHDLEARATLPRAIRFTSSSLGRRSQTLLTFSEARRVQAAYPLPAGLRADLDGLADDEAMRRGLQAVTRALAPNSPGPPSAEVVLGSLRQAIDSKRWMAALMTLVQFSQQYGGRLGSDPQLRGRLQALAPGLSAGAADPDVARFQQASRLAEAASAPGDRAAALHYLGLEFPRSVPFSTFRFVTYANLVRGSPDLAKSPPPGDLPIKLTDAYWMHIAAYPWSANAYKDAGDTYLTRFDIVHAWLAYDLGRAVDPDYKGSVMGYLDAGEARVRLLYPDAF